MNTYEVELTIKATVEAFNEKDAKEIIDDNFGPGEDCGLTIISTTVRSIKEQ